MMTKEELLLIDNIVELTKKYNLIFENKKDFIDKIIPFLKQTYSEYSRIKDTFLKYRCARVMISLKESNQITFNDVKKKNVVSDSQDKSNISEDIPLVKVKRKHIENDSTKALDPLQKSASPKKTTTQTPGNDEFATFVSNLSFKDIAINGKNLEIINRVISYIKYPQLFTHIGIKRSIGVIVYGFPGCGKTYLIHTIAGQFNLPIYTIYLDNIASILDRSQKFPRHLYSKIKHLASGIILFDGIDAFFNNNTDVISHTNNDKKFVSFLCNFMDEISNDTDSSMIVFATTSNIKSIDPSLRRPGRFEHEIPISIPDEITRLKILNISTQTIRLDNVDLLRIARLTPGFVASDLVALVREASLLAVERIFPLFHKSVLQDNTESAIAQRSIDDFQVFIDNNIDEMNVSSEDFMKAIEFAQPSSKREGFCAVPADVTWNEIGALDSIREALQLYILGPIENPERFNELGLQPSAGIMLVGPPGCGKTMIAKAIANQAGLNFISVRGPELLNAYVGESERAVRNLFSRAQNSEPCVIFFDEIDSLCPSRTKYSDSQHSSRMVNQLLTEMDGILSRSRVFILAATNQPEIIDSAIMRKGRFDKIFYVGLPTPLERSLILKTITKNGSRPLLDTDVNLNEIAHDTRCDRFSGADLYSLVKEASLIAFKRVISEKEFYKDHSIVVNKYDFENALKTATPSISIEDWEHYELIRKQYS